MKFITCLLCLGLAAVAGVTPASAQKVANFHSTPISNNCAAQIDLRPGNIFLRQRDTKIITARVQTVEVHRADNYVPENTFLVNPGWSCSFEECISSRVTLFCFSVDGKQRGWHTFNRR
jgi:hypothetical protein